MTSYLLDEGEKSIRKRLITVKRVKNRDACP